MPKPITMDQLRAVCAALGLEEAPVRTVTVDVRHGVNATLLVRNATGNLVADGDDVLTATIRIPMAGAEDSRPYEWCCEPSVLTQGRDHASHCTPKA